MSETAAERRAFETASLAVELASAIITARGGEWSVADAVDLVKNVKREIGAVIGDGGRVDQPAVPVDQSVKQDYIVCLEDGKKLKLLKRYLKSHYGMTPEEYRRKWGLAADYPMAAPNYSEDRRQMARRIGLGKTKVAKAA